MSGWLHGPATSPQVPTEQEAAVGHRGLVWVFWGEEKCHSAAKNLTVIPLSFCPQLSHLLQSAMSAPSHVTQHTAQPTAAQ